MTKLIRLICCVLYYGFAQWLPASYMPGGAFWKAVRYGVCRPLFGACGRNVNVEHKVFFHSGRKISIGDHLDFA